MAKNWRHSKSFTGCGPKNAKSEVVASKIEQSAQKLEGLQGVMQNIPSVSYVAIGEELEAQQAKESGVVQKARKSLVC